MWLYFGWLILGRLYIDWDFDNNHSVHEKNHSQNKNVNYKNIIDVPKNLIKRKVNNNII